MPEDRSDLSSSVSLRTWNFESSILAEIPLEEESAAVLEYLGFQPQTAKEIFDRYTGRPDPNQCPDSLLDYAHGQIAILRFDRYREMDIQEAMARVGLTEQIRSAIADPTFSDILWTEDLYFWVRDTLDTNYATFLCSQDILKRHAGHRIEHASEAPGPGITAIINMTTQDFELPANHVALLDGDAPTRPDHVLLYKGKAYWDLLGRQLIEADGSVNTSTLATFVGGDFNCMCMGNYWTPEKETAIRYREWAARRNPGTATCVIQIQVSKTFLDRLRTTEMWYSPNWKEFVWRCRQREFLPDRFHYIRDVDLIKGHISTGMSDPITRIAVAAENVQACMTRDNLLLRPSDHHPATQWMFNGEQARLLQEEVRGKIHIEIFAPLMYT